MIGFLSALEIITSCAPIGQSTPKNNEVSFPIYAEMRREYGVDGNIERGIIVYNDRDKSGNLNYVNEMKEIYPKGIPKTEAFRAYWEELRKLEAN